MHELSAIRSVAGESVLLAGGGAAILLQLADPRVARGVAEHSDFAARPFDRLIGTLDYIYAVVFAEDAEARAAVRLVNRAHGPVRGEGGEGGEKPAYSAFDPDAQLWVAATLYRTAVHLDGLLFGERSAAFAERLYADYAVLGTRLQMPAAAWPPTRAAFADYWAGRIAELEGSIGDEARSTAHALLFPAALPRPLRPVLPLVRLVTAGLLPPGIRAAYGIRWTPHAERVFRAWIAAARVLFPLLPAALRHAPRDAALRRLRRRLQYAGVDRRGRP